MKEKDDGLVTSEEIANRVKDEVVIVRRGIKSLGNKKPEDVEPMEVFAVVKMGKENLDGWVEDCLEVLWKYELRSLLKGDPVKVKVYQRLQMQCFAAKFEFIKAAQKAMDEGKDMLVADDWRTMRK